MFRFYNPNPGEKFTGDCTIRALSILLDQDWMWTYLMVCIQGFLMFEMPSTNRVWGAYLYNLGFHRHKIPQDGFYTVRDFCFDHPYGRYLLALDGHVLTVINGDYYDTGDSGYELPLFYWRKEQ